MTTSPRSSPKCWYPTILATPVWLRLSYASTTVRTTRPRIAAPTITRVRVTRLLGDGGLAVGEDRPVRHVASRLRTVPVLGVRRDERDVAGYDRPLLALVGHDPLTFGDHEDLVARVHMPLVRRAVPEVHLGQPQVAADVVPHRGLHVDVATEDRIRGTLTPGVVDVNDPHASIVSHT